MTKPMRTITTALSVLLLGFASVNASEIDLKGIGCVMSGKEVSAETSSEYKDAKVYFCCGGCASGFAKNQAKYAVKANHQLVATKQYEQVACPFSGRDVNPDIHLTIAGTKVGFCCDGCKGKVASGKDDAAKLKLVFDDKAFAKGFKKAEKKVSP
tara:strand:+ start:100867 stop:101331 length:465 start_codon:yes stop_codon:yes gene_type:complete